MHQNMQNKKSQGIVITDFAESTYSYVLAILSQLAWVLLARGAVSTLASADVLICSIFVRNV